MSLQLIPKATEGCVVFSLQICLPPCIKPMPTASRAASWTSEWKPPLTPMGTSSGAKLLLCWPVSAEAHGASDGTADTKGPRGAQVSNMAGYHRVVIQWLHGALRLRPLSWDFPGDESCLGKYRRSMRRHTKAGPFQGRQGYLWRVLLKDPFPRAW